MRSRLGALMKIIFVLPLYKESPIGGFKVVYEYANHLVRTGHEVTIIYPWQLRAPGTRRSPLATLVRWRTPRSSLSAYLAKKPDVSWTPVDDKVTLVKVPTLEARYMPNADAIFATAWQTSTCVNKCPSDKGAKFYLVMDFAPWLGKKSVLEQTWRLPLKKIAISHWLAETVLETGVPKEDIRVIPIAVDHDRFRVTNDIVERPARVIMQYSAHAYKRSKLGVSALSKCKEAVPNLQASLFGPARKRPARVPSWIEYYGGISESQLVKLFNAASICLCSSVAEGFALPPAEAMACGCAVVTTDCGGNRDYAEHEKTALVSDADDFASLVSNTLRLLSDEELRAKIALAGRERMMDFTWEKSSQQLTEFIRYNL
jgi:glycosyltransferase involved in cell wall biosynthesis